MNDLKGIIFLKESFPIIFVLMVNMLVSCGNDEKKKEPEKGEQYLLIPYVLGDPSKVEGGSSTIQFTITGTQKASTKLRSLKGFTEGNYSKISLNTDSSMRDVSEFEIDHSLRTLINRFDPDKGYYQGEWFWLLAKKIDRVLRAKNSLTGDPKKNSNVFPFGEEASGTFEVSHEWVGPIESQYLAQLGIPSNNTHQNQVVPETTHVTGLYAPYLPLTASSCPKSGESVYIPNVTNPSEATTTKVPAGGAVEGADYCIVYLSSPVSEPNKDNIKNSIETILKVYKKSIYGSDFETTPSGFVFKPIIVVLDFKDKTLWPESAAYQVDGVFAPVPTLAAKQPMLYMSANLAAIRPREADLAKKLFHSTLAHEFQHAVFNYFRVQKADGTLEIPSLDEGLAHFMEDLFGFGEENFGGFAKSFLDIWADTYPPAIYSSEDTSVSRGGAQVLWYYLVSQKGGVTFSDGVASGGDGLKFIADVVKNVKARGPKGLAEKFGADWASTMGNFFLALAVDNTTIPEPNDKFKVAEPQQIKDLLGNQKKFGMRFNNFGGLPVARDFAERKFESGAVIDDLSFYSAVPLLYEISDPSLDVSFVTSTDQGTVSVARVRVK